METYSAEAVLVRAPKLAARLKRALDLSDLNLRQLAKESEVDKGTISQWTQNRESGEARAVKVEAVRAVARVLDVEAEYLLDLPPPQTREKSEDADLIRRLATLGISAGALENPATEMTESLKQSLERFTFLTTLLEELRELTTEARRVVEGGDEVA